MKFKTDAQCKHCSATILDKMRSIYPDAQWSMDLENADKVLEVHGIPENGETAAKVIAALEETGFTGSWIQR